MITLYDRLTVYSVHVISPRTSFAILTTIGSSILPVSHVSSWACSAPSLMLDCKSSVTKPHSDCGTFLNGVRSSSVISSHYWIATVNSWDSSATSVFEASKWLDYEIEQRVNSHESLEENPDEEHG